MRTGTAPAIRFVTFDVGGTLIHPHPSVGTVYSEVLTRRGFPVAPDKVERAFDESWEEVASRVPPDRERYAWSPRGERGYWRELLDRVVERLGGGSTPPGAAEELFERFGHRETWRVFPEVPAILEDLSARGFLLGVLSNWDSRLPVLLRELDLRKYFGPILVSALEGYEKPDPRIFHLAAGRAGVRNEEMLHVGDRRRDDGEGARRAGCRALILRQEGTAPGLEAVPALLDGRADSRVEAGVR